MAILALPSVPWVVLDAPPVAKAVTGDTSGWMTWLSGHVITVVGFGTAAYISYSRDPRWPLAVLVICSYVAIIATPPMALMWVDDGFFALTGLIWKQSVAAGGTRAFYLIWNLIVLPIVPALLAPFAGWFWWKSYRGYKWA